MAVLLLLLLLLESYSHSHSYLVHLLTCEDNNNTKYYVVLSAPSI